MRPLSQVGSVGEIPSPQPQPIGETAPVQKKPSYADLYCTDEDRKKIAFIITTVDEGGIDLLWKSKKLYDIGEEILPVHPYKFLSTILLDPILRLALKRIFKDLLPFKKSSFLGGVKRGMEREFAHLDDHIAEFASEMGTTVQKIRPLIQVRDWNGLVCHLLERDLRHKS